MNSDSPDGGYPELVTIRILHLNTYGSGGGAARAAAGISQAMQMSGLSSRMLRAEGYRFLAARRADRALWHVQKSPNKTWRSPSVFGSISATDINSSSADVVNLHWVSDGFLSIEQIGKITKPLVMSMYDMWPFMGTEHYGDHTVNSRWRAGYTRANRPAEESGFDLDRWTYQRKIRAWGSRAPIHMVPASSWLQRAVQESALMGTWPATRIPHVVDEDRFSPMTRSVARQALGLDGDQPTILFLASAGIRDERKGFDLLERALPEVRKGFPGLRVIIAGPGDDSYVSPSGVEVVWIGQLNGDAALRTAYCAADVVAVPSREDNMPLTAMEAQTCGRPVVAFGIGGLVDIIDDQVTGILVEPDNTGDLSDALVTALDNALGSDRMGTTARERAVEIWSPAKVVSQYLDLYETVLGESAR